MSKTNAPSVRIRRFRRFSDYFGLTTVQTIFGKLFLTYIGINNGVKSHHFFGKLRSRERCESVRIKIRTFLSLFLFFPVIKPLILRFLALSILLDDSLLMTLSLSTIVWEDQPRQATCQPNLAYLNLKDAY